MVKRLRHHPFTVVSRVRISVGSPLGSIAQLGEHLPYKQGVTGSSPVTSTIKLASPARGGPLRRTRRAKSESSQCG